ncbi:MAG: alpha/beta fold hydrolase [Actinomycetota bacterium]
MADGLILMHAFPLDSSMYDRQFDAFIDRTRVLAPNFPGFGASEPEGEVMTMDEAADRVVEEMDKAGIDKAVVAGVSMGGYAAFSLWRRHRDRIDGLLLANTKAEPDDEAGAERRRAVASLMRESGIEAMLEAPPPLLSANAPPELWDEVKRIIAKQPALSVAAAAFGMAERPDSTPVLADIDVPTICVTGSGDTLIPPELVRNMATAIGADYVEIEGAGHLSNMEAPEAFNQAISDLLDRCGQ